MSAQRGKDSQIVQIAPELQCYEDVAVDLVVSVINKVLEKLGKRQSLSQIAYSRKILGKQAVISLTGLKTPLAITSEQVIKDAIEKVWKLTDTFLYHLKYLESFTHESSKYYYYEAIFSQPTVSYPVPQVTASVFFRVEDKLIDHPALKKIPRMTFRMEGHFAAYDVRYVKLIPDWILAVMMMKLRLFKRVERIKRF
ncbi:hypothetical protein O0L34_g2368 [Tuta absoluta]|nr:hypothetical protein O0L34_g2368 [Tuta absoluta]